VRENSTETLELLMKPRSIPEGTAQQAFVSRDGALDLPALAVDPLGKALLHLASVLRLGPLSSVSFPSRNDGRSNPERLPAEYVVVLGVVSRVSQDPIKGHQSRSFLHGRCELGRVLRRPHADVRPRQEMGAPITDQGHLGPAHSDMPLLPLSPHVVSTDMAGLQARGVHDAFRALGDELQLASAPEDLSLKNSEGSFFKRRFSA
jgi:hypothetical protein